MSVSGFAWSEFASAAADAVRRRSGTWPDLIERISSASGYPEKAACPWIKLAEFGDVKTDKGSLRHNANVRQINGIEGDYDGGEIQPGEAIEMLERAGVRAMVYTSPSHTPERPRWRVVAPCSRPLPANDRTRLVARINGVLGGLLAGESFTLSQAYYFGALTDAPDYRVLVTFDDPDEGRCVDELDELDEIAIGKPTNGHNGHGLPAAGRNTTLSGKAYAMHRAGTGTSEIVDRLREENAKLPDPLPDAEVVKIGAGKASLPRDACVITDFYAHMPSHTYLYTPTRETWPSASVNGRLPWPKIDDKPVAPAAWLDKHRPIEQMVWHPGEPELIADRVMQVSGWVPHPGAAVFNLYRPPTPPRGEASQAGPWLEHVRKVYPDDADHLIAWLAHKAQHPGEKCNHAIVLGGLQGIGKDTLLEPMKAAVGAWNWSDISPTHFLGRFNAWQKAVIIRVNEARDLGEVDRFGFYDRSKVIIAAPPDVLRVDEKHLRETYVANVCGVVITTNYAGDGLYLPADDRRHYVAWSPRTRDDFPADYWTALYRWYAAGGIGHVCAYLAALRLDDFDPKAPPPKTPAFWQIVAAGEAPESGELRDLIEAMGTPAALTLGDLIGRAEASGAMSLAEELRDRKTRRAMPHRLERVGYVPVRNPDADDGLFKLGGKRQVVYAQRRLPLAEQIRAARGKA